MRNPEWERMMDPRQPLPFELPAWVGLAPFEQSLGMEIARSGGGEAVLTMPFRVWMAQGKGLLHGGALTALADTSAAMAVKTLLPEGIHFGTVELATRFLAPVMAGTVTSTARAWPDPERERTYRAEAKVTNGEGTVVAEFTSVFRIARKQA